MSPALQRFAALRLGFVIGLVCLATALPLYTSYEDRQILGRYSPAYAAVLALVLLATIVAIARTISRRHRRQASPQAVLAQLAVATWGIAYLVAAVSDRRETGRLLDLNIVGSVSPLATALEWAAMFALAIALVLWVARRIPAPARNLLLMVASVILVVLLGEAVARAKAIVAPTIMGVPTHSGTIFTRRYVTLNKEGFRDVEHAAVAPPGTKRLLLIGDSFAFGAGIRRTEDRFGEQLAQILSDGTGERWSSICACRVDRNTLHHQDFLRRGLHYQPDAIVLLYVFNDIEYLAEQMGFDPITDRTSVLFEHPRSVGDRVNPLRVLYWNSYLAQEVMVRLRLLEYRWSEMPDRDPYADSTILATHMRDLAAFVELGKQSGAVVGIVPFDPFAASDEAVRARHDRFVEAARVAGVPVWPIRTAFDGQQRSGLTVNALDYHPSPRANRLAAQAASRYLLESLEAGPLLSQGPRDAQRAQGAESNDYALPAAP